MSDGASEGLEEKLPASDDQAFKSEPESHDDKHSDVKTELNAGQTMLDPFQVCLYWRQIVSGGLLRSWIVAASR